MQQVKKLVSKKELKSVYGIPYCFAHIARLEAAGHSPRGYGLELAELPGSRMK